MVKVPWLILPGGRGLRDGLNGSGGTLGRAMTADISEDHASLTIIKGFSTPSSTLTYSRRDERRSDSGCCRMVVCISECLAASLSAAQG